MPKLIALCTALLLVASACGGGATSPKAADAPAEEGQTLFTPNGSRVTLWLPEGTVRPLRLLVFTKDNPQFSIGIGEMTGWDEKGMAEMMEGAQGALDEQGFQSRTEVSRGGASGFIAEGESGGLPMKALLLRQGMAIANISVHYESGAAAVVEKILDSIRLNGSAALDPLALHGIRITDLKGFEVWPVSSHPIIMREPGTKPPFPPEAPTFVVMVLSYEKPNPSDHDLGRVLGGLLADMQPNLEQAKKRQFKLDGLPAFEIAAPGKKDGVDIEAYGFIARGKESAIVGIGHVGKKRSQEVVAKFVALADSIELEDSFLGSAVR